MSEENMEVDSVSSSICEWMLIPRVEETNGSQDIPSMDRLVSILDQLDARVEKLRKEALKLQENKDFLLMSVDLLKNNEHFGTINDQEREELNCYLQRVNDRLSTVKLNVYTVRDDAQEECMHQVNGFIDALIASHDPVVSKLKCQQYLNACASSASDIRFDNVDKKFENAVLGCTLDDQKIIKKRLQALYTYLTQQTVKTM